jgi:hypothetical protein
LGQIFSSTPCSQTPSVYVLPLMPETKLHPHYSFEYSNFYVLRTLYDNALNKVNNLSYMSVFGKLFITNKIIMIMNLAVDCLTPLLIILEVSVSNFGPVSFYLQIFMTSLSYSIHVFHIRPLRLPLASRVIHYLSPV